ncbi:MAG: pyridoxal-phosphate dependent enzyme [Salinirussus sp.]
MDRPETTRAFDGLRCTDCGSRHDATTTHRCPACDGHLDAVYDHDEPPVLAGYGLDRYAPLLPFPAEALPDLGAGGTPVIDCPALAADLGVGALAVKDEGHSSTGSVADRGMAVAVAAAGGHGATDVALPTTGNAGQAAAAYAARAGLDAHAFVPSRATFATKAMINVHGGDMSVVGGRYPDAVGAFEAAVADAGWYSLAPFETPYRHEGAKTLAYELAEGRDWGTPDAVVLPVAHGTVLVGLHEGFVELQELGLTDRLPRLCGVQAAGCAPVVEAVEAGADTITPCETPDTICGDLEVPTPAGGDRILAGVDATGGTGVAVDDDALLDGATELAAAGLTASAAGGATLAGARELADRGTLDRDDDVVLVDTATANRDADVLRSHLMKQGI